MKIKKISGLDDARDSCCGPDNNCCNPDYGFCMPDYECEPDQKKTWLLFDFSLC